MVVKLLHHKIVVVESLSRVWLFATAWTAERQASLSFTSSQSLLRLMSIELVMSSNHLILCCCLLLPPSIFPSNRVFSNESAIHIRWPKYWNFIFSISPSNEYSGLFSFRIDWFDLAVQGTLKSLLQCHNLLVANSSFAFLVFSENLWVIFSVCGWLNWWTWNPQIWEADCM